ncbi:hypothetical protein BGW36DRAFT_423470 [Talaromyces proteolyticus]|uniref:Uncharacterized protein n=1 Tax=Talaromyces proteolyticus TaxID=1131652 RepID=A0AAD4KYL0_9EURO|nr:uncharacterized protein BGW36DRAFT_423470 [Talaromyces proteolyticus]KAH8703930.1 hypothetical protein BGW36DRAFT_423470 [Talaromyces proteolyticus]
MSGLSGIPSSTGRNFAWVIRNPIRTPNGYKLRVCLTSNGQFVPFHGNPNQPYNFDIVFRHPDLIFGVVVAMIPGSLEQQGHFSLEIPEAHLPRWPGEYRLELNKPLVGFLPAADAHEGSSAATAVLTVRSREGPSSSSSSLSEWRQLPEWSFLMGLILALGIHWVASVGW